METINVDERSMKEKWNSFKFNAACKIKQTCDTITTGTVKTVTWIVENPKEAAMIAGAGVAVVKTATGVVTKVNRAVDDHKNKTTVYCNDIQQDVRVKHELNYEEARELRDLMNEGYTKFEALDKMNLLRK